MVDSQMLSNLGFPRMEWNLKMSSLPSFLNQSIWTSFTPWISLISKPCRLDSKTAQVY